jgi:hypothetical protein
MDNGQLMSHVDTDLVTRDQLALVPAPQPTATWRPIPHIELIETLDQVLRMNQIAIQEEKFALRRDGPSCATCRGASAPTAMRSAAGMFFRPCGVPRPYASGASLIRAGRRRWPL